MAQGRFRRFLSRTFRRTPPSPPPPPHVPRETSPPPPPQPPRVPRETPQQPPPEPRVPTPDYRSAYWKAQARNLIRDMDPEFYYGVKDYSNPSAPPAYTEDEYLELGEDVGYDELHRDLTVVQLMQNLYWSDEPGDRNLATEIYLQRPDDLPDWFWRYHGINS